ncbi:Asp-tRNA(Asn)/Glu-tRNA(Gln) amidotransferase subunit GatC [Phragmitibacter flavus]|nr:Asp-tRNA(Asn)/Glu-tRNA(Gln) amidotransferase subunit GatC [Phragmitibacter flavus]
MAQQSIDIQHAAKLARLQLSSSEVAEYQGQLGKVIDYMATLEAYDLGEVEPMAHAMPVFDVWREDVARSGFTAEEALLNAPRKAAGQFLVNRSVEDA